jgi:hypothetical protein
VPASPFRFSLRRRREACESRVLVRPCKRQKCPNSSLYESNVGQIEICPGRCLRYRYVARKSIALVFLDDPVAGVTPAPIAEEGYLDTLDLKNDAFTVVGYGTDEFITGSAASPKAITDAAPSGPPA